jgi:recombination protein RecA
MEKKELKETKEIKEQKEVKKSDISEKLEILDSLAKTLPIVKDKDYAIKIEPFSSGSISLDLAIGIGGYPRGALIDIFGEESSGKSLLSIMAMAQIQKIGGTVVVWDAERSYSKNIEWMRINGVDTSKIRFLKLPPDVGAEEGFDAIEKIIKEKAADLIVIDSIPSLIPSSMLKRDVTDSVRIGERAAMLTNVLPRLVTLADEYGTTIMTINQMRQNIGGGFYGPQEKETSIMALKHHATLRLFVKKITKSIKIENGVPISHRINIKIVKNKVAAPYKTAEFEINYTKGVNNHMELAEILVSSGLAKSKGGWIEFEGKKYHGIDEFVEHIKSDNVYNKYLSKIKSLKLSSYGIITEENNLVEDVKNEIKEIDISSIEI